MGAVEEAGGGIFGGTQRGRGRGVENARRAVAYERRKLWGTKVRVRVESELLQRVRNFVCRCDYESDKSIAHSYSA